MADDTWHSLHPAPLQDGHERLTWWPPTHRTTRVRVRAHTCECAPVIYELCQATGLMFIRRVVRSDADADADAKVEDEVRETAWLPSARTKRLWTLLLEGLAR
jgi:hypothetical protein